MRKMLGIIKWDVYGDISHFPCPPNWLRGHFSAKVKRNSKKNKQNLLQESLRIAKVAILPSEGGLVLRTK